ncbi:unnamed protein product [Brassica oleracea var. botrytis]|uniref:(rape) hypothetical protein n=1 Tax=Brassica napus TaxID=3708 RepID=A0A078J3W7_BRANA|nr:unnamed protein product [Brassica napus]CDY58519.1 BnaCnng33320D [Brassica napus]
MTTHETTWMLLVGGLELQFGLLHSDRNTRSKVKLCEKARESVQDSHGVRWRVRARTGVDGSLPCYSVQVFVSLFRSVDSLRHARGSGLGFCLGKTGSLQIFFLWIRGEERGDRIVRSPFQRRFDPGCRGLHSSCIADKVPGLWRLL